MKKPTICIWENKDADQLRVNCEADQRLCFRYTHIVLQIYGVFYRDPEIGFKLFFLTDSCSRDLALQESD